MDVSANVSPTSNGQPTLTFCEALKQVALGKKITKLEWTNKQIYGHLDKELLKIHGGKSGDNKNHDWILTLGDLSGSDWVVID